MNNDIEKLCDELKKAGAGADHGQRYINGLICLALYAIIRLLLSSR